MMFLLIEINSSGRNFLIELPPAGLLISVAITLNSCDHNGRSIRSWGRNVSVPIFIPAATAEVQLDTGILMIQQRTDDYFASTAVLIARDRRGSIRWVRLEVMRN